MTPTRAATGTTRRDETVAGTRSTPTSAWIARHLQDCYYPHVNDDELDCLACGVCCRTGRDGTILIPPEDLVRWRAIGREELTRAVQPGHFGLLAFATRDDGSCVHLGTSESPHACQIYEVRGTTCREFERGSAQCHEFRRDFGLE